MATGPILFSSAHPSAFFSRFRKQEVRTPNTVTHTQFQQVFYLTKGERARLASRAFSQQLPSDIAMAMVSPTFQAARWRARPQGPASPSAHRATPAAPSPRSPTDGSGAPPQHKTTSPSRRNHFRPVDFQTKVELDHFFGQTKLQRRELALHMRDTSGKWWFDAEERDENRGLLSPNSPLSPAATASRRNSGYSSVPATPTQARAPGRSLAGLTFSPRGDGPDKASDSPTSSKLARRRSSGQLLNLIKPLEIVSPGATAGVYYQWGLLAPEEEQVPKNSSQPQARGTDVTASRPRVKRSSSAIGRLNVVGDWLPNDTSQVRDEGINPFWDEAPTASKVISQSPLVTDSLIRLPSYLPLPHRQVSTRQLDEAFGSSRQQHAVEDGPVAEAALDVEDAASEKTIRRQRPRPDRLDLSPTSNFKSLMKRRSMGGSPAAQSLTQSRAADYAGVYAGHEDSAELLQSPCIEGLTDRDGHPSMSSRSAAQSVSRHVASMVSRSPLRSPKDIAGKRSGRRPWSSQGVASGEEGAATVGEPISPSRLTKMRRRSSLMAASSAICAGMRSPTAAGSHNAKQEVTYRNPFQEAFPGHAPAAFSELSPPPSYSTGNQVRRPGATELDAGPRVSPVAAHRLRAASDPPSPSIDSPKRPVARDSRKAETLLGAHPLNRHLLAPAGLPTGPDVYDGLVFDGPSYRLESEDEDEEEGDDDDNRGNLLATAEGVKAWLRRKKRRVARGA
ncbi:unnamed protein product [Parajaminaea phylloscopi]